MGWGGHWRFLTGGGAHTFIYMHTPLQRVEGKYECVCVSMCACSPSIPPKGTHTHTHTGEQGRPTSTQTREGPELTAQVGALKMEQTQS